MLGKGFILLRIICPIMGAAAFLAAPGPSEHQGAAGQGGMQVKLCRRSCTAACISTCQTTQFFLTRSQILFAADDAQIAAHELPALGDVSLYLTLLLLCQAFLPPPEACFRLGQPGLAYDDSHPAAEDQSLQQAVAGQAVGSLQAGALAVRHVLGKLMRQVSIKWPNDIYIGDSKVSGTLIQLDVAGESIRRAVIGVGINVNQETFRSDAPNPVSLINVLGHETELRPLLRQITERFAMEYDCLRDDKEFIRSRYLQHLWRLEGKHPYRDKDGEFMAEVVRVENDGHLVLRDAQGRERSYAFGEVDAVL